MQPIERQYVIGGHVNIPALGRVHVEPGQLVVLLAQPQGVALSTRILPAPTSSRIRATVAGAAREFGAPMQQRQGARLFAQRHRPVQGRVSAAADHEIAPVKVGCRLDAVVDVPALEILDAGQPQAPRLEGTHPRRDHHGPRGQTGAGGGGDVKFAAFQGLQFGHFLSEVEGGVERLRLFQEPGRSIPERRKWAVPGYRRSACRDTARCTGPRPAAANR